MDVETQNDNSPNVKAWLGAMRLRTLPLALASTLTGGFLAMEEVSLNGSVLFMTALTTTFLQVNSNLANDYGDFSHGTDNEERVGPERAMQSGAITEPEMRRAIWIASILSFLSGITLLYLAPLSWMIRGVLLVFGVAAIFASIKYTAGRNPYGYRGLGDVSVMAFFGILGVVGAYLCQTGEVGIDIVLPALTIGAFSTGVLNINNTRDIESDRNAGKITLVVKMGPERARLYHVGLILLGCSSFVAYAWMHFAWGWAWLFLAAFPLFALNAYRVFTTREAEQLDPMLKQLALSTFLFSLLIGIGQVL
ncbi:MAG: 1,4-dihydroxy-2-naphthoate polyprenyltransferase [Flavobacteriales bacterium]|nr:1,4-dihydroxy-2-naphthoate polyprenyltransferase [Flavobacteriales bacterium]